MANPKFEIFKGQDDQFYFRLRAKNDEIILQSEGYEAKGGCQNGIESVKTNAPVDERYKRSISSNDKWYFALKAANLETIGMSEMYESEQNRENGIESVKENAPISPIEDTT